MAYKRISPQPVIEGGTGATTLTAHGVLLGEGTSAITPTAVGTNGQVLVGSSAADPGWVTPTAGTGLSVTANASTHSYALSTPVTVANGGTGDTSLTAYAVLCGGTTSTNPIQSIASVGTSGQFLTSNGAGALPTFQTAGAATISITGDSGGALTSGSFTFTGGTTGLTFAGAGSTETLGGTLVVSNGGTGDTSFTAYAVICGGTTSTGALQSIASVGSSGNVLMSNGAGALPTFQAAPGGGILTATLDLTNAQIKALATMPIQIIAAPGVGKTINLLSVSSRLAYGGNNAFTNPSSDDIWLYYNTNTANANRAFTAMTTATITATANTYILNNANSAATTSWSSTIAVNTAIVAALSSSSSNIAGNASNDNTISITVSYQILSSTF